MVTLSIHAIDHLYLKLRQLLTHLLVLQQVFNHFTLLREHR